MASPAPPAMTAPPPATIIDAIPASRAAIVVTWRIVGTVTTAAVVIPRRVVRAVPPTAVVVPGLDLARGDSAERREAHAGSEKSCEAEHGLSPCPLARCSVIH